MNFVTKFLPQSELEIKVTIPFEEFQPYLERAIRIFSEEIEIEGFRKGKAPPEMVKKLVKESALLEKAAELAIKKTYPQVIQELSTTNQLPSTRPPIGPPEITITKLAAGNELEYSIKLALLPEVKLPDYKAIAQRVVEEKIKVEVSEEEVERTLNWIRNSRAVGEGDRKNIPELTDEFARSLGNFPNVEALKNSVAEGLRTEKEMREKQRIRSRILEEIAKAAEIEVPSILVEAQLDQMLEELKSGVKNIGMKWEDYLAHLKKTPEELREAWREDALNRVKSSLSLREIGRQENIQPTEEEIQKKSQEILLQFTSVKEAEDTIDPAELREYTKSILRNEKVFEFLETIG